MDNVESINSTLRQINFIARSKYFWNKRSATGLPILLFASWIILKNRPKPGVKLKIGETNKLLIHAFKFYNNELILGDNTVITRELDAARITYLQS